MPRRRGEDYSICLLEVKRAEFEEYHAAVPGYLPRISAWKGAKQAPMSWALVVENSELETLGLILGGLGVMACRFFGVIPPYLGLGG